MTNTLSRGRFPEFLQLKLPAGTNEALEALATATHRTKSEVVRRAVLSEIEARGITLAEPEPREVLA